MLLANRFITKYVPKNLQKTFKRGLLIKLLAALFYSIYHQFIFGGGDTFFYYLNGRYISEYYNWNFFSIVSNLFVDRLYADDLMFYQIKWVYNLDNFAYTPGLYMIIKISAFINYFALNSILSTSLLFAAITYMCLWFSFTKFIKAYNNLERPLSFAYLFYPSIIFWGNSISKDSVCIACVAIIFGSLLDLLIFNKSRLRAVLLISLSLYILAVVKTYIAICFVPTVLLWVGLIFNSRIKNENIRTIVMPILLAAILAIGIFAAFSFLSFDARFESSQTIAEKIKNQQLTLQQKAGSAYSLGVVSDNIAVVAPFAIGTTLFRPFIWEVSNIFMLLSFVESLIITLLCYLVFIKWGFFNAFKAIRSDNFMIFTIVFTLIFAIGVGSSSGNFGTLVRYKIPCLPFFGSMLIILFNKFTASIAFSKQNAIHKLFAKYLLGQKPPSRFHKQIIPV